VAAPGVTVSANAIGRLEVALVVDRLKIVNLIQGFEVARLCF
jgi:hypothetical protein